jgi:hypothetical protein
MGVSKPPATVWRRIAAPDGHVLKAAVAMPLSTFSPQRPASALRRDPATRDSEPTI